MRAFALLLATLGILFGLPTAAFAAAGGCTLTVPADPTSATGLATPYRLHGCDETVTDQAAFVEATILDPATGALSVYHPLVVNNNDRPATPPVPVTLPANAVVGIWFGSNANTLNLVGRGARGAVDGFGQFAYINAPAFFAAANRAIQAGKIHVPDIGMAKDGKPCPTTRDFFVVDQDQSDNLVTAYWNAGGLMSQQPVTGATKMTNGSDEGLLAKFIDPALGCTPWTAPDLTNPGTMTASLALNELSAAAHQAQPMALVPTTDPMVVDGGARKTNSYRAGVNQPVLPAGQTPQEYCTDLTTIGQPRLTADAALLKGQPGPGGADLLSFLTDRFAATLTNLGCPMPKAPLPHGPRPVQHRQHF